MSTPQFAEPRSPWALNSTELDRLRRRLAEAEQRAEQEPDWVQRTRAEQDVVALRRQLQAAEFEAELTARRERSAARSTQVRPSEVVNTTRYMEPVPYWRAPDRGNTPTSAAMVIENTRRTRQQYAEPVPYFAAPDTTKTVESVVENARARRERVAQFRAALDAVTTYFVSENKRGEPPQVIVGGKTALLVGVSVEDLRSGRVTVTEVT